MILFHGLPGNEQNLDLAQAIRRANWNVLTLHYRGSLATTALRCGRPWWLGCSAALARLSEVHRCTWAVSDPLMQAYHDEEWGVPEHDGRALWVSR